MDEIIQFKLVVSLKNSSVPIDCHRLDHPQASPWNLLEMLTRGPSPSPGD